MMNNEEKFRMTFREEAAELLADLEEAVLCLENNPKNQELINRVFRSMHTIKGSGAMFGFHNIADFTHHLETALDLARSGKLAVTQQLINLLLQSRDQIQGMLNNDQLKVDASEIEKLLQSVQISSKGNGKTETAPLSKSAAPPSTTYRLRVKLSPNIMNTGLDPLCLFEELRSLGECVISAQTELIPDLDELEEERCYFYWDVVINTKASREDLRSVFLFVEDDSEITITPLANEASEEGQGYKKLGQILIERGDVDKEQVQELLAKQKRVGELMVEAGLLNQEKVESALTEQKMIKEWQENKGQADTIRVSTRKLDRLINLVGEMVITQAQLTQTSNRYQDQDLSSPVENMERLTGELRDCALNIRMLPVEPTFAKFRRLVRDLSASLGKNIALMTSGGETELDKTVIERIHDPLVHLIRNSVDHGIELPEDRRKAGKPEQGTLRLSAGQSGGEVVITIEDDGAGLNKEKILAKAIEVGLINQADTLTETQIQNLIFQPGFSTAAKITDVSGRGVGMDVVKREITKLRGSVNIESKKGQGTKISIHLPLTLAIIEGLLTIVNNNRYVIPLTFVRECIELGPEEIAKTHGRHIIQLRGETIPYIRLREFFKYPVEHQSEIEYVVIAMVEGKRIGLAVDHIIGDYQAVIKSLGKVYEHAEGVSGATFLGDGTIALIIDIRQLLESAQEQELASSIKRTSSLSEKSCSPNNRELQL